MKLRDMLEMLSRHDGDLRVTIGGEEWEGGASRVDRNRGWVVLELTPGLDPLKKQLAAMKERADRFEYEAAELEDDVVRLREHNSNLGSLLLKSKEALESVVRGLSDVVVEPIRK
ncbi:MAG: hypothetical protein E6Q97_38670 [Desulfurellales bacterium]|nr:MAG: hypothetical protein E6Q97_38670 [Desulfurellales bacterium]